MTDLCTLGLEQGITEGSRPDKAKLCVDFSPDNKLVVTGSNEGNVTVHRIDEKPPDLEDDLDGDFEIFDC